MIDEYFAMSFNSLRRRKLRSWLTLLGIFIGIAAVVALISLGQGLENSIVGEFERLGGDKLLIQADSQLGSQGEGTSANPLSLDEVRFLESQSGVLSVTYYVLSSARMEYRGEIDFVQVIGVPTESPSQFNAYFDFWTYDAIAGRELRIADRYNALLGYQHGFRNIWNGENIAVGDKFSLNDKDFRAAGFYEATGSGPDDQLITVTAEAYEELFGPIDRVDMIVVQVADESELDLMTAQIERRLAQFRGVRQDQLDFEVETPLDLLESFQSILDIVQAVLIGIAGVSLFVGGIGIMNTMYTSVLERKKDIGIMKAIGAKNQDIFLLFLFESGLLGLVGGVLGIIVGAGMAWLVEIIGTLALGTSLLEAYFSWELFVGAVLFSFFVGALAGTLPAWQASKEQAADTLRDE